MNSHIVYISININHKTASFIKNGAFLSGRQFLKNLLIPTVDRHPTKNKLFYYTKFHYFFKLLYGTPYTNFFHLHSFTNLHKMLHIRAYLMNRRLYVFFPVLPDIFDE